MDAVAPVDPVPLSDSPIFAPFTLVSPPVAFNGTQPYVISNYVIGGMDMLLLVVSVLCVALQLRKKKGLRDGGPTMLFVHVGLFAAGTNSWFKCIILRIWVREWDGEIVFGKDPPPARLYGAFWCRKGIPDSKISCSIFSCPEMAKIPSSLWRLFAGSFRFLSHFSPFYRRFRGVRP